MGHDDDEGRAKKIITVPPALLAALAALMSGGRRKEEDAKALLPNFRPNDRCAARQVRMKDAAVCERRGAKWGVR